MIDSIHPIHSIRSIHAALGAGLLATLACGAQPSEAADPAPTSTPTPATAAANAPTAPPRTDTDTDTGGHSADKLLAWLDPDAVGAAAIALPSGVDVGPVVSVFALPPRAEALLTAASEIDAWLGNFVSEDAPPQTWLGQPALAMVGRLSVGPTVVRPMTRPRAEVAAILTAGAFDAKTLEGFEVFYPNKSFPYRIVLLDESVLAFVPTREPGSGLSPLTAGRDLPASDLQRQLEAAYEQTPGLYVELFVAGPLMHFDLDPPLVGVRFELLPWRTGGLEGRVLLQPERDVAACVDILEARVPLGETDRIVQLADQVAYQLDAEFIVGVLRLEPPDLKALGASQ